MRQQRLGRKLVGVSWVLAWLGGSFGAAMAERNVALHIGETVALPFRDIQRIATQDETVVQAEKITANTLALTGQSVGTTTLHVWSDSGRETLTVQVEPALSPPSGEERPLVRPVIVSSPELLEAPAQDGSDAPLAGVAAADIPLRSARDAAPLGSGRSSALATDTRGPSRSALRLEQAVDKTRTIYDDLLTYTLTGRNEGPEKVENVTLTARVPAELEYVEGSATEGGVYDPQAHLLRWSVPTLLPAQEVQRRFQARVRTSVSGAQVRGEAEMGAAQLAEPVLAKAVLTEVIAVPLLAAFAVPDVIVARRNILLPLLDVEAEEAQRTIDRLQALGILDGYPDNSFLPQQPVTRAEATKMVVLATHLEGLRDRTSLTYALSRPAVVTVTVTDAEGRVVRRLVEEERREDGSHAVLWDGCDDSGVAVSPGVYRYEVNATSDDGASASLTSEVNVVSVRPIQPEGTSPFTDVKPQAWYSPYVAVAEKAGLVKGYPGNKFLPRQPIQRVEETVLVVRAAGLEAEAQKHADALLGFEDEAAIPAWARGHVAVATREGPRYQGKLLIGYPSNKFEPRQKLTRQEAAAIMERFVDRDTKRLLTVSGAVSMGTRLSINGRSIESTENGRFREEITLQPEINMISVLAR